MSSAEITYIIDSVQKKENRNVEIIAYGIDTENIATSVHPEMTMALQMMPNEIRNIMDHQNKIVERQRRPMIRFEISVDNYNTGEWMVNREIKINIETGAQVVNK